MCQKTLNDGPFLDEQTPKEKHEKPHVQEEPQTAKSEFWDVSFNWPKCMKTTFEDKENGVCLLKKKPKAWPVTNRCDFTKHGEFTGTRRETWLLPPASPCTHVHPTASLRLTPHWLVSLSDCSASQANSLSRQKTNPEKPAAFCQVRELNWLADRASEH